MKPIQPSFPSILLFGAFTQGLTIPAPRQHSGIILREAVPDGTFTYEPIKTGFVAFGDSYAAGVGAGPTSEDGCRLGAYSYPNQLNSWVKSFEPGIKFQNYACSGAVVTEVLQGGDKSQIDKWENPSAADRATISIGGNDVGFYDVLTSCVLRVGQFLAGDCDYWVGQAYTKMYDPEFAKDVANALRQILEKSGREDFRLVHTGYPTFFNDQTDSCDYTTFYMWQPGHHSIHRSESWAYLYKAKRTKLNKLVTDLNTHLQAIIDEVNKDYPQPRVLFADPNPAFNGHRFCEEGIVEPDSGNEGNWLFLASWPDYSPPGAASAALTTITEATQDALTKLSIPDDATCASTNDWGQRTLCDMAKAGIAYNNGSAGVAFSPTVKLPDDTEISINEIGWLKPTKWVKTFHPRSLGHLGYRELVRGTW